MSGHVFGKAFVDGLGEVYVEAADRPDYLHLTHIKSGYKYLRRRDTVNFRPGKYKDTTAISR